MNNGSDVAKKLKPITNFFPVGDQIAVFPDDKSNQTKSGLYLPDNATKPIISGHVLAAGPECTLVSNMDRILISPYHTGIEIEINEKKVLVIKEKDVLGIIKNVEQ